MGSLGSTGRSLGGHWEVTGRSLAWHPDPAPPPAEGSPRHRVGEGGSLDIANVTRGDAGTYGVQCRNAEGSASTHLVLLVHCASTAPIEPYGTL